MFMFSRRGAIMLTVAAAVVGTLSLIGAGCGSGTSEYDKAANYTPEAVAQELILRYRTLSPDGKTPTRGPRKKLSAAVIAARDKADHKAITRTTKKRGPNTIDDVLDDLECKITLIKETSPAETTKKVIEVISGDRSLNEGEKKTLTELAGRLGQ
jgi:hypothetical protein